MQSKHGFKTTEARSSLMRKIKSKDTKSEIKLRKHIWNLGFRYRLNLSKLPGKPDLVFEKHKLVVFIDGEFWHGYKWKIKKNRIKANREYWIPKIERNITRDRKYNKILKSKGYIVLRFWENDIKNNLELCVKEVVSYLK